MKSYKSKGFTLVELIVVIAIIGVLAAILVPSMLGYVKRSKITSANSTAKTMFNAVISSLTELQIDNIHLAPGDYTWSATKATAGEGGSSDPEEIIDAKIKNYFSSVYTLTGAHFRVNAEAVTATAVSNGTYYGAYPTVTTSDAASPGYGQNVAFATRDNLLDWAEED